MDESRRGPVAMGAVRLVLSSETETAALAARLAPLLRVGDVVALSGGLGAGKTSFARALLRALGHVGEVPSPTFTLVQTYETVAGPVWHIDLYRLGAPGEVLELGIEEAFADAITVIEWPDRLGEWLPAERLDIDLDFAGGDARSVTITGHAGWRERAAALVAGSP